MIVNHSGPFGKFDFVAIDRLTVLSVLEPHGRIVLLVLSVAVDHVPVDVRVVHLLFLLLV